MGRSPCCDKARVKRGPWSQEEDAILRSFVQRFGNAGNWIALPQKAGLKRCGKSCRLRWLNYLRPELRHGSFTDEEDNIILSLYGEIGSKWSVIASRLPGRTDNDVKNHWNTKLKKRFLAAAKRETTPLPPSPPPPPPSSSDSIAAATESQPQDDRPMPQPETPCFGNLDTAVVDNKDELLVKSEQLYSEILGLIEQESMSTNAGITSTTESLFAASASSSGTGTSPAVSSSSGSCDVSPMDVQDTALLSESISSLFDGDDAFDTTDLMPAYSFQDLLATSYYDEFTTVNQELLYY